MISYMNLMVRVCILVPQKKQSKSIQHICMYVCMYPCLGKGERIEKRRQHFICLTMMIISKVSACDTNTYFQQLFWKKKNWKKFKKKKIKLLRAKKENQANKYLCQYGRNNNRTQHRH